MTRICLAAMLPLILPGCTTEVSDSALATALRESGLTLTGGGVFEQPREPRGDASAQPHPGGRTDAELASDEPLPPSAAPRLPRARGVLDLYA